MAESCNRWRELIVLRSLGDPESREAQGLDEHLDQCAACRAYRHETSTTVDRLPFGVPRVAPPARLRRSILDALHDTAADTAKPGGEQEREVAPEPSEPFGLRRLVNRESRAVWRTAALVVLLAGNIIFGYSLWQLQAQHQTLATRLARAEERLLETEVNAKIRGAEALLGSEGATLLSVFQLAGTDSAPDAFGKAALFDAGGEILVFLAVANLSDLSGDQAYQLWLIEDGNRTDGGTFRVDADGASTLVFRSSERRRFQTLGITLEPDSRGHAPRGAKVLGGNLPSQGHS